MLCCIWTADDGLKDICDGREGKKFIFNAQSTMMVISG